MSRTAEILVLLLAVACPAGLSAQTYPSPQPGYAPVASTYGRSAVTPAQYQTPNNQTPNNQTPITSGSPVIPASYGGSPGTPARSAGALGTSAGTFQSNTGAHGTNAGIYDTTAGSSGSSRPLPPRGQSTQDPSTNQRRGLPSIVTLVGGLGIVLGVFFVLTWGMRRFTPQGLSVLPSEAFEVLGRAPLAGRQQAHLLRCGNKLLLVSVTPTGAETLGEVTDLDEVERLTALCRRPTGKATETLRQVLGQWTQPDAASESEVQHG